MTDEKPEPATPALQHLAEIYRLLGKNEARIAGLTRQLEELLRLLGENESDAPSGPNGSKKPAKSDGRP